MDSSQGIPVEYKLDAFNMPRTGTTLCHPQNWLCQRDAFIPLLTPNYKFTSGPLQWRQHILSSPKIPDTRNYTVTLKFNPSHVRRHTLPSQPSQLLITQFRLNTHNLSTSLAAPKANPIFHAANKTTLKTFRPSASYLLHPSFIYL